MQEDQVSPARERKTGKVNISSTSSKESIYNLFTRKEEIFRCGSLRRIYLQPSTIIKRSNKLTCASLLKLHARMPRGRRSRKTYAYSIEVNRRTRSRRYYRERTELTSFTGTYPLPSCTCLNSREWTLDY